MQSPRTVVTFRRLRLSWKEWELGMPKPESGRKAKDFTKLNPVSKYLRLELRDAGR